VRAASEIIDPRDLSPDELIRRAGEASLTPRNVRRWLAQVIGEGNCDLSDLQRQGILPRRFLLHTGELPRLRLDKTVASPSSGFRKLVFRTVDELSLECVLIPLHKSGAVSLCLSSQIGCVMGCSFCATGRMAIRRDLESWEIVDQFIQARALVRETGGHVTGAVFMGMGEPFLNYDRVLAAAELFCFPVRGAISAKAITVSTAGLVPQIDRFTLENRPFRLSISLGGATDEKRRLLVPIAARTPVAEVMAAARRHGEAKRERVMLSYVCISGVNVSEADAKELADLIGGTQVRLDLIDVNDSSGRFLPPSPAELSSFRDALRRHVGQPVTRRYSGGLDIQAACGTLAGI
jgi:23S rRNA (adenine2503-C2)-methyltransferase